MSESISSRLAGLQVPISRIATLAAVVSRILEEQGAIEDEHERREAGHITNLVDLIAQVARQAGDEAEGIERDATRQSKEARS